MFEGDFADTGPRTAIGVIGIVLFCTIWNQYGIGIVLHAKSQYCSSLLHAFRPPDLQDLQGLQGSHASSASLASKSDLQAKPRIAMRTIHTANSKSLSAQHKRWKIMIFIISGFKQWFQKVQIAYQISCCYLLHGMHISTAIYEQIFTET